MQKNKAQRNSAAGLIVYSLHASTPLAKRKICVSASRYVGLGLWLALAFPVTESRAAELAPVAPDPQKQGVPIPPIKQVPLLPPSIEEERRKGKVQEPQIAVPTAGQERELLAPIRHIEANSPFLAGEISVVLSDFMGLERLAPGAIDNAKTRVRELFSRNGRIAQVDISIRDDASGSSLVVVVLPVRVRQILVEQEGEGHISRERLDRIGEIVRSDIPEGSFVDLNRIDNRLMQQRFVGDITARASLVVIDPGQVDVKVVVYDAGTKDISYGAYYDNSGMSAYGANRYAVNVRIPGRLLKGDDLDGVAMHSNGMDYQQVGYELPVVPLASRFQVWGSQMRYQVGSGVHGYVRQVGATMSRLIYGNANVSLLGWLEYADKRQWDWLANDTSTGDKGVTSWRLGLTGNRLLSNGDSLLATAGVRHGQLDLSRLPAVLVQDAASAQTQGEFVTMDWRLSWSGLLSRSSQVDFRAAARGQFASKNLDTGEKFILGGPSGVRAYGSVEGMGDSGQIINLEAGYLLAPRVRGSIFYDAGWITRYHTAWETGTTPNRYGLQGWGIGISTSWRTLDARLTWAQQIGTNSGLNAQGQDSEGLTRRDRLWATLSWRI